MSSRSPGPGRPPLPLGDARSAGEVKVALRASEMERLDAVRGSLSRAEYVRRHGVHVWRPMVEEPPVGVRVLVASGSDVSFDTWDGRIAGWRHRDGWTHWRSEPPPP